VTKGQKLSGFDRITYWTVSIVCLPSECRTTN